MTPEIPAGQSTALVIRTGFADLPGAT